MDKYTNALRKALCRATVLGFVIGCLVSAFAVAVIIDLAGILH